MCLGYRDEYYALENLCLDMNNRMQVKDLVRRNLIEPAKRQLTDECTC